MLANPKKFFQASGMNRDEVLRLARESDMDLDVAFRPKEKRQLIAKTKALDLFHGLSRQTAFKRLIDAFRLRIDDEYSANGDIPEA